MAARNTHRGTNPGSRLVIAGQQGFRPDRYTNEQVGNVTKCVQNLLLQPALKLLGSAAEVGKASRGNSSGLVQVSSCLGTLSHCGHIAARSSVNYMYVFTSQASNSAGNRAADGLS